ncbi:MAG: hypothetical protein JNL58_14280 [Planctomyces sp.]|nr:hypothetical protein [Planctomyces sp.]
MFKCFFGIDAFRRLVCCLALAVAGVSPGQQKTGTIDGQLKTEVGEDRPIEGVAVFVVDAETGYPLLASPREIFSSPRKQRLENGIADCLHTMTDHRGHFRIEGVPAGKWRLTAQSWKDSDHVPLRKEPDREVTLHGVADSVEVTEEQVTTIELKPLGDAAVVLENEPKEGNAYLFISTVEPDADPILGPFGWGKKFLTGVIGLTHEAGSMMIIRGLPRQKIYVSYLNYDNNPGIGGVSFVGGETENVTLHVYAGWSNGYFQPPEHLSKLVDYVDQHPDSIDDLLKLSSNPDFLNEQGKVDRNKLMTNLESLKDQKVSIDGFGEFRATDMLAAQAYSELRKYHLERAKNK